MEKPEILRVEGGGTSGKKNKNGKEVRDSIQVFYKQSDHLFLGYLEKTTEKLNGEKIVTNETVKCKQCSRKIDGEYYKVRFPVRIAAGLNSPEFKNVANWEVLKSPKNDHKRM